MLFSDNEAENQLPSNTKDTINRRIPKRAAAASRKSTKATVIKGSAGKNRSVRKNESERIDNDNSDEDVVMINDTAHEERDQEEILSKTPRASAKRTLPRTSNRSSVRPLSSCQATLNFSQSRNPGSVQRRQQPVCLKISLAYIVTNERCRAKMRYPTTKMLLSLLFLTRGLPEVIDKGGRFCH